MRHRARQSKARAFRDRVDDRRHGRRRATDDRLHVGSLTFVKIAKRTPARGDGAACRLPHLLGQRFDGDGGAAQRPAGTYTKKARGFSAFAAAAAEGAIEGTVED